MLRGCLMLVVAVVGFVGLIAIFPLIQAGQNIINTTANVTQYEGMAEVADFSPLLIILVVGFLLVLAIFGIKLRGHHIFGGVEND